MRNYLVMVSVFIVLLIIVPMVVFIAFPNGTLENDTSKDETFILGSSDGTIDSLNSTVVESTETDTTTDITGDYTSFKVLDSTTNEVLEVSARDYVIGSVCAEMPALFEVEAIKTQAVVSYTYAVRLKEVQSTTPTAELHGADFSNDSSKYQAFFTNEQIREYYGSNYDEYYAKVSNAVDEVLGEVIVYDGEPIVPVFHSISSGKTEDAKNVWGYSVPYLVSVDSPQDVSATDYNVTKVFTPTEIQAKFSDVYPDVTFSSDCTSWISVQSTSDVGSVLSVTVGNLSISGQEFKNVLALRSTNFQVSYDGDTFTIETKGYGHGVGLSQYGANQLAIQGYSYLDIIKYYYYGVDVVGVDSI